MKEGATKEEVTCRLPVDAEIIKAKFAPTGGLILTVIVDPTEKKTEVRRFKLSYLYEFVSDHEAFVDYLESGHYLLEIKGEQNDH